MKTLIANDETHKKLKVFSATTGINIKKILWLLVANTSEKQLLKLAEKELKK